MKNKKEKLKRIKNKLLVFACILGLLNILGTFSTFVGTTNEIDVVNTSLGAKTDYEKNDASKSSDGLDNDFESSFDIADDEKAKIENNKLEIEEICTIDDNVIMLDFNDISGAKNYEIYRANSENGKYRKISETEESDYMDYNVKFGKNYYYKVGAKVQGSSSKADEEDEKNQEFQLMSEPAHIKTQKAKIFSIVDGGNSEMPYTVVNGNKPYFDISQEKMPVFEYYSGLDEKGRCQVTMAMIDKSLMPKTSRESIGSVKPSGWHSVKYSDLIGDKYLYNRCHLIGFQLTGENANPQNLITGTRFMNVDGMFPFENKIAKYVKKTNGKVLYRVRPIFVGDELVCRGVEMEAYSVSDGGKAVCFNVFAYNSQPLIDIDYKTGESKRRFGNGNGFTLLGVKKPENNGYYVFNIADGRYHTNWCEDVGKIKNDNKRYSQTTQYALLNSGYEPCEKCVG